MALPSLVVLRGMLQRSSQSLCQLKWSLPQCRQSSSFPLDDDRGSKELPPLNTPKLFVSGQFWVLLLFHSFSLEIVMSFRLSRLTTDEKLQEAFSPYGHLLEARVITDRVSGRSKGFGFVMYSTIEEADKARRAMNAKFLDGWVIFVDPAKPKKPRSPPTPDTHSLQKLASRLRRQSDGVGD
ncbi:Glycine-rich RNA-binding protein blt801 [Apostasia shenzhenica]|uniref:Glycine-rich RNA-binding protein blt801 n=1 Tax=Apostasia shenzhenica TaxID=1088818 RepID=A0A2I0B283_9ASPA|nr:Glycine-rich RNA-binding protein blt801 [Apostasia shenzhenica]